ncbi:MAG: hypothetical protein J5659_07165 [Clostridia bacterium]|nr:hypothetical protein [Clostridia bacterium]
MAEKVQSMSKSAKSEAGRVGGDVGELGRVCGESVAVRGAGKRWSA